MANWNFDELSKTYGLPIIGRVWLPAEGRWPGLNTVKIDSDDLPEEAQYRMTRHDVDGFEYGVYRYNNHTFACRTWIELEPTAEDLAEWQAASSGCGYYTFIGQPWRD